MFVSQRTICLQMKTMFDALFVNGIFIGVFIYFSASVYQINSVIYLLLAEFFRCICMFSIAFVIEHLLSLSILFHSL